ncbi:MAG: DUF262 domain-containing protein [Nitrosopumilus sp.]|nr:DUF262 domain-containing protein [Nitrosopumilus sp.]
MNNWVWSVTPKNWPVVKHSKVWAVESLGKGKNVKKGDRIIFHVKASTYFQGAFRVASDWHRPTVEWPDESRDPPVSEIDLKEIQIGFAKDSKLLPHLAFTKQKTRIGPYLRGSAMGPGNFGKPISDYDYDVILAELKLNRRRPAEEFGTESDTNEMIDVSEWKFLKDRIYTLDSPNLRSVFRIIALVKEGKLAIPVFQRDFKWNAKQIKELWESLFQGFFVGSILTWGMNKSVEVHPVDGGPPLDVPTDIILDGQQRITSLYKAVSPSSDPKEDLFFVDLKSLLDPDSSMSDTVITLKRKAAENKGYLDRNTQFTKKIFPLSIFNNNNDYPIWLSKFKDYLMDVESYSEKEASEYHDRLSEIMYHVCHTFEIPMVQLPDHMDLDKVAEVFERINSRGTPLVMFDLLNAKFIMLGIELKTLWSDAQDKLPSMAWISKANTDAEKLFIQSLCLYKRESFRRKEVFKLDDSYTGPGGFSADEFMQDWDNMCSCFSEILEKIRSQNDTGFGAVIPSMVPYTLTIPIMAALLYKISGRDDRNECMKKIETWYWSVIFSDRYSGSTDTMADRDFREMQEWFDDDESVPEIVASQRHRLNDIEFNSMNPKSSMFKAVMCLVARNRPVDFVGNGPPDLKEAALHRIFPEVPTWHKTSPDSCLNMTRVSDSTWTKFMKGSNPSEYTEVISSLLDSHATLKKRLEAHLISHKAFKCMKNDDYEGFINMRTMSIREELGMLIKASSSVDGYIGGLLSKEESDRLERKSSLRWNTVENKKDKALECLVTKSLCAFMNAGGGDLLIGIDDHGKILGLENDYSTLQLENWDGFYQHIMNIISSKLDTEGCHQDKFVKIEKHTIAGKDVCRCKIMGALHPVHDICNKNEPKFFVRRGNKSELLNSLDTTKYIKTWNYKDHSTDYYNFND